jgi:hypothetical protein
MLVCAPGSVKRADHAGNVRAAARMHGALAPSEVAEISERGDLPLLKSC